MHSLAKKYCCGALLASLQVTEGLSPWKSMIEVCYPSVSAFCLFWNNPTIRLTDSASSYFAGFVPFGMSQSRSCACRLSLYSLACQQHHGPASAVWRIRSLSGNPHLRWVLSHQFDLYCLERCRYLKFCSEIIISKFFLSLMTGTDWIHLSFSSELAFRINFSFYSFLLFLVFFWQRSAQIF